MTQIDVAEVSNSTTQDSAGEKMYEDVYNDVVGTELGQSGDVSGRPDGEPENDGHPEIRGGEVNQDQPEVDGHPAIRGGEVAPREQRLKPGGTGSRIDPDSLPEVEIVCTQPLADPGGPERFQLPGGDNPRRAPADPGPDQECHLEIRIPLNEPSLPRRGMGEMP